MTEPISNEMLNAYIDNELDEKEAQLIEAEIKKSSRLQKKLQEFQQVKLKIQASYAPVRAPIRGIHEPSKTAWLPTAVAASLTLVVGLTSGWLGHQYLGTSEKNNAKLDELLGVKLQAVSPRDDKIMIHLAQNDQILFDKALAKAEALLERFESLEQKGMIQVLANSNGMDIMRNDKSPYRSRIVSMMDRYDNIQFVACQNTIQRLESDGENVELIDGVKVHGPVINEIVTHMQDGWTYIKI